MKLVKYTPMESLDTLFDRLNRGLFPAFPRVFEDQLEDASVMRLPRTNIEERDESYVFTLEMPGVTKNDVEVSVENDTLFVKGGRTEETEDNKGVIRREIRSTRFERSFNIGGEVDQDKIKARMEDGVLTVTLPKKAEKVGRKVSVD